MLTAMSEHSYLFRASDASGKRITGQIMALSAENAVLRLQREGFTEIELHTDDVRSRAGEDSKHAVAVQQVRPAIRIRLQAATPRQARWLSILNVDRKSALGLAVLAFVFLLPRYNLTPFGAVDYGLMAGFVVPLLIVLLSRGAVGAYQQMQQAVIEARYEDVLRLTDEAEPALRKIGAPGILDLAVWRAKSLVKLGRMDEALALMEEARLTPGLSQAAFHLRLAEVYGNVPDFERMRQCYEEAIRIEPNQPGAWMGLAELLAKRFGATAEARAALGQLNLATLSADTRQGLLYIEGIIALNERRFHEARQKLEAIHAAMAQRARALPLAIGLQRQIEALLAMACAGAGDRAAAEQYFAACRDFLRLHQDEDLLRRCQAALD